MARENLPDTRFHDYDDEISLFDLWLILRRRFWAMVLIFVAVVVAAMAWMAWTLSGPDPVRVETVVRIGTLPLAASESSGVSETVAVEPGSVVAAWLRGGSWRAGEGAGPTPSVSVAKQVATLSLTVAPSGAEQAKTTLEEAANALVARHGEITAPLRGELQQLVETVPAGSGDTATSELRLSAIHRLALLHDTEVLAAPAVAGSGNGPSVNVIFALAVVLGGMLAVFGAFMVEFVTRANDYARRQGES